jgi:hypothetical protein
VRVSTVDGAPVFSRQGLKARAAKGGAAISVSIPAKKLARNDYILTLSGIGPANKVEEVEKYFFRVDKK